MRVYKVYNEKKSFIVAAHNPKQATEVSKLKGATAEEVNITEPVIIFNG
jgi:hypothetical protein